MTESTARKSRTPHDSRKGHVLSLPMTDSHVDRDPHSYERWMVGKLMRMAGSPPVRFRLWNGAEVTPEGQEARFTLHLKDPKALYALVANPNLAFGDLYSAGRLAVEGDLPDLMETLYRAIHEARQRWPRWLDALWKNHNPRATGIDEAKENIHHHYDLGNDFYRLWLDQAAMQYTCAYYEQPDLTLEQAQLAKLEHVCRKLRLRPAWPWWKPAAAGVAWPATWPVTTASRCTPTTFPASRSAMPGKKPGGRACPTGSSTSKTTTATSPASTTPLFPSACWNTSARTTIRPWRS